MKSHRLMLSTFFSSEKTNTVKDERASFLNTLYDYTNNHNTPTTTISTTTVFTTTVPIRTIPTTTGHATTAQQQLTTVLAAVHPPHFSNNRITNGFFNIVIKL